jgi:hypothetical protein
MHRPEKRFKMDLDLLPGFFQASQKVLRQIGHHSASYGTIFSGKMLQIFPPELH